MATTGLASEPARFVPAVSAVSEAAGLPEETVAHDYWIVRALHGIHSAIPANGEIILPPVKKHQPERFIGHWAFGGGTSLTAAWGIVERYSEDIDGLLFLEDAALSKSSIEKACDVVARVACDASEAVNHETKGPDVKSTTIDLDGHPGYLKIETALQRGVPNVAEPHTVRSLIAMHSDEDLTKEFPELGGFSIPCVRPV